MILRQKLIPYLTPYANRRPAIAKIWLKNGKKTTCLDEKIQ